MPSRRQIDPIEISRLLPIVLLADITPAGTRIRLLGSEATDAYGQEMRGCLIGDVQFGEFSVLWLEAFDRMIQSTAPTFVTGTYRRGTELRGVSAVLMPLADDGLSVRQIFGGLAIGPDARDGGAERERRAAFIVPVGGVSDGRGLGESTRLVGDVLVRL